MLCKEQVAQLARFSPRFATAGARVCVVGNGNVTQAARFAAERKLPFALYTDPSLSTYAAAGLKRGVTLMGAATLRTAREAMRNGHHQSATEGDPWQQGGAFLILPDGRVPFSRISEVAGDHFDPEDALAVLNRVARPPG